MTRYLLRLDTASDLAITPAQTKCNPVMRVGALSEVEAEKAALGRCITSRVNSGESNPAKCREQHSNRSMFRELIPLHPKALLAEGIYRVNGHEVTATRNGGEAGWHPKLHPVNGTGITAGVGSPWYASSMALHGIREVCPND